VNSLFEVFQAPGKKLGQFASVMPILGREVASQAKQLKDQAEPMTKSELLEVVLESFTQEERARIRRYVRVLGAASLKTAVLVELDDGSEAVLLAQRPGAEAQNEGNFRRGRAFLAGLKQGGTSQSSALLESVIDSLEAQLKEEVRMTLDVDKTAEAARRFGELAASSELKTELGSWRIVVPQQVPGFKARDNALVVRYAKGVSFDQLSPETQKQVGPLLVKLNLQMLFRTGWFDADRHMGNWRFDPEAKVIAPLDFGQLQRFTKGGSFSRDDVLALGSFIAAIGKKDAKGLVKAMRQMSIASDMPKAKTAALEEDLTRLFVESDGDFSGQVFQSIEKAQDRGIKLAPRFAFGALKGLMVLAGEEYVSKDEFARLLGGEVRRLMMRKMPALTLDRLSVR
jgi:predicted unusual protein kinase regulating ubiquinone biosynthesis (AarF/ABC1/UbiB family)